MKRTLHTVWPLAAAVAAFPLCLCSGEEAKPAPQGFECQTIETPYVHLPIQFGAPEVRLLVTIDGELQHSIDVRLAQNKPDWNGTFSVQTWMGKSLTIVPEKPLAESSWTRNMKMSDQLSDEEGVYKENWPFAGFHAARVAAEKSVARAPAISREPWRRGPDAKMVCITASSRTAASLAANGRADRGRRNLLAHTSTHVIIANASAA